MIALFLKGTLHTCGQGGTLFKLHNWMKTLLFSLLLCSSWLEQCKSSWSWLLKITNSLLFIYFLIYYFFDAENSLYLRLSILECSRTVDEMDKQILQHASLKVLYFYRLDVTAVRTFAIRYHALCHDQFALCKWIIYLTIELGAAGFSTYNVRTWRSTSALLCLACPGVYISR